MKVNITVVKTPDTVQFGHDRDVVKIGEILSAEFKKNECWTDACSDVLYQNPKTLFLFDRMEYFLGNAFGDHRYKQALNPLMIKCHHPSCIQKSAPPRKLRHICDISDYVNHLKDHCDVVGNAMLKRFSAVMKDNLLNVKSLDEISVSPADLITHMPLMSFQDIEHLNKYGIDRQLNTSYICHWKDKMIKSSLIDSSSLSFQEDDALAYLALSYPNPVHDWKEWRTLFFYAMKMLCWVGASALNLHRGTTDYKNLSGKNRTTDVKTFIGNINHPSPSITTLQRFLPRLSYDNETFHSFESLFHLEMLEEMESSIKLDFDRVTVYPSTLGIDEQVLNAGTFEYEGYLYGLAEKMGVEDIQHVGLNNLANHIAEKNPYISSVCEYHVTDLGGKLCSNVYTKFESTSLKHDSCTDDLKKVVTLATQCSNCIRNNISCEYALIHEACKNCIDNDVSCKRFSIFNVLWDMATPHKKTANTIEKIDLMSSQGKYLDRNLFSISYAGLHLAKACVNSSRNHILSHCGENFGVNILWFLKNGDDQASKILSNIKNAVFVGKDRQSDYLSYMTCCPLVQKALKEKGRYSITKIPERIKTYSQNAKSQKQFLSPISMKCNLNGDIFLLDSGMSCLHVIDRSVVAKCFTIGVYNPDKQYAHNPCKASEIMLSRNLAGMEVIQDDILVADTYRNEIMILHKCSQVNKLLSCKLFIIEVGEPLSICSCNDMLLILMRKEGVQKIEGISYKISKSLQHSIQFSYFPEHIVENIFSFLVDLNRKFFFGVILTNDKISLMELDTDNAVQVVPLEEDLASTITPSISGNNIYTYKDGCINKYNFKVKGKKDDDPTYAFSKLEEITTQCPVISLLCAHGEIIYTIGKVNSSVFILEESGLLNFAFSFCEAINKFYNAVCYVPPHGEKHVRSMKISDCIQSAEHLNKILLSMQADREKTYPSRKSFMGNDGIPFTQTIDCIDKSIEAWKAVCSRLDSLGDDLSNRINPYSLVNEALVERCFGFTMKRGQNHQQNMMEYIQSRRNVIVDFMIKMCITPFNQYTKVKLRDKGYQHLDEDLKPKIRVEKLLNLFSSMKSKASQNSPVENENTKQVLRSAFLLTKSVPRATNRAKWKQASGYQPDLLQLHNPYKMFKGDLVFFSLYDESLLYLQVVEDLTIGHNSSVKVTPLFEKKAAILVQCKKLLADEDGLLFTIPSNLYTVKDNSVVFTEVAKELFDRVINKANCQQFKDDEWALLCETSDVDFCINDSKIEQPCCSKRKTDGVIKSSLEGNKRMRIVDSDSNATVIDNSLVHTMWRKVVVNIEEDPDSLIGKWFASIYQPKAASSKRKALEPQLIFGPIVFCSIEDGHHMMKIDCCKPYDLNKKPSTVEEYMRKGDDEWNFRLCDIIAGPLNATFLNKKTWCIDGLDSIIEIFHKYRYLDRDNVFDSFYNDLCQLRSNSC